MGKGSQAAVPVDELFTLNNALIRGRTELLVLIKESRVAKESFLNGKKQRQAPLCDEEKRQSARTSEHRVFVLGPRVEAGVWRPRVRAASPRGPAEPTRSESQVASGQPGRAAVGSRVKGQAGGAAGRQGVCSVRKSPLLLSSFKCLLRLSPLP